MKCLVSVVIPIGSQLGYFSYFTELSHLSFCWVLIIFQMRNQKLKRIWETYYWWSHSVNQDFLSTIDLFRERKPKFKGGVMYYSFCNSITCWIIGTHIVASVLCCCVILTKLGKCCILKNNSWLNCLFPLSKSPKCWALRVRSVWNTTLKELSSLLANQKKCIFQTEHQLLNQLIVCDLCICDGWISYCSCLLINSFTLPDSLNNCLRLFNIVAYRNS
jgi:hypothetical protein